MAHRLVWAMVIFFAALLAAGCNGAKEIDAISYVLAIGVDKGREEKTIDVTYLIAVPRALAAGGEPGDPKDTSITVTLTVSSLAEARNLLNSIVARIPNLTHVKVLAFGEEYAKKGLLDIISVGARFRELRGSIYIFVVNNGTARDYLEKSVPRIEMLTSRYFESMMLSDIEGGYIIRSHLHTFYKHLKSGSASPVANLVAINKGLSPAHSGPTEPGEKTEEYLAGQIQRKLAKANASEVIGLALFNGDKMAGALTSEETRMVSMLRGHFQQGYIIVADPLVADKGVNTNIRLGRSPKIKSELVNGKPVFSIKVDLEGEVTSIPSGINYEQDTYRPILEKQIAGVVKRQMEKMLAKTQRLGSDPVGFGYYLRPRFKSYDEFAQLNWDKLYQQAEFQVEVKCRIRRTSLMIRTLPVPGAR